MNKVLVALCAGLFALGAYAASHGEKSRADVKAEAAAANTKGDIAMGESNLMAAKAEAKLTKEEMTALRAMIKAEAASATKKGDVAMGEKNQMAATAEAKLTKEEMTALRTKVKAEAADAVKKGTVKMGNN